MLAAAIPAIITWAHRRGRRAFRYSIIGGATATGIAYVDWLVHDRALSQMPGEIDESVFVFIMLAIYGLLAGLAIAALADRIKGGNFLRNPERQPSPVMRDE